ncbi:MAG: hypothetical protein WA463_01180 [Terriglobales bacterium]
MILSTVSPPSFELPKPEKCFCRLSVVMSRSGISPNVGNKYLRKVPS